MRQISWLINWDIGEKEGGGRNWMNRIKQELKKVGMGDIWVNVMNDDKSIWISINEMCVDKEGQNMEVMMRERNSLTLYKEDFYFVDLFHGSAHYGDQCIARCEVHTNFTNESAFLTASNIQNEVVTIHSLQQVLKMLSLYM
jgi:hypothetical protein